MATRDLPPWARNTPFDSEAAQNLLSAIFDRQNIDLQQELTSVADGDFFYVFDVSETGNVKTKKISRANVLAAQINQLLDISGASGGQIKFPATQNASSDANTLDDYEEGTWTPNDSSGAGLSLSSVSGNYRKVGGLSVSVGTFTYPATADGTAAKIGGFPFAPAAGSSNNFGVITYSNIATPRSFAMDAGAATGSFYSSTGGALTNAQMSGSINQIEGGAFT